MPERDWRDMVGHRLSRAGLVVVLAAAAGLRLWKLGHGVPHAIGPEEPEIVDRAFMMMKAGTVDPAFHGFGQLSISLQLAVSVVRFVAGSMSGEWYSLEQATSHPFYPAGRALVALLGVLTVLTLHRVGRTWGARHALLAAAMLTVLPAHVRFSQLVVPDVLLTLLATITLSLSLRAAATSHALTFAAAGFAAGLAAATRYSGALTLVMPLCATIVSTRASHGWDRTRNACATACGALAGFLVGTPYAVLSLPQFLEAFGALAAAARSDAAARSALTAFGDSLQGLMIGTPGNAPIAVLTWTTFAFAAAGLVLIARQLLRGPHRAPAAIALSYLAVQVCFALWLRSPDPRVLLPVAPILCLATAEAVLAVARLLRERADARPMERRALLAGLTVIVLAPAVISSAGYASERSKESTEDLAFQWIRQHAHPSSVVLVEASAMSIPRGVVDGRGIETLARTNYEELARDGVDYVIATSTAYGRYLAAPADSREEYMAYMRLFSEAREVARFSPSHQHPGPELRVLQIVR